MPPGVRNIAIVDMCVSKIGDEPAGFGCERRWVIALSIR